MTDMKTRTTGLLLRGAALAAVLGLSAGAANAQETLRAIATFPKSLAFTQSFLKFVDKVNAMGEGVVQIQYMGGPEVVPPQQQADAVRRGVVDMNYGPTTYYLGTMPEADAWVGATVNAAEARENGGFEVMQEVVADKLGVKLLAHLETGVNFYIYTTEEPKISETGGPDLTGMQLRSQPIYNAFFQGLGAVPVSVPVPDVYTGLERGTFDGVGWPIIGVQDLSWDKFLKYRIDPGFFSMDLAVLMNPEKWESLSTEAKEILTQAAVEYEKESSEAMLAMAQETDAAVREKGMTVIELEGEARDAYLDAAYDSAWGRLKESGSKYYETLREHYYTR